MCEWVWMHCVQNNKSNLIQFFAAWKIFYGRSIYSEIPNFKILWRIRMIWQQARARVCVCLCLVDVICVKYMSMAREFYTKKLLTIPVEHPSEKTKDSPTLTSGPLFGNVFPQISLPLGILRYTFIFIAYAYACRSIVHMYIWLRAPKLPLSYAHLPIFFSLSSLFIGQFFFHVLSTNFPIAWLRILLILSEVSLSICNTFNSIDEKKMKNTALCVKRKKKPEMNK